MTTYPLEDRLTAELVAHLQELETAGQTRRRRVLEAPCGRIATVDGKWQGEPVLTHVVKHGLGRQAAKWLEQLFVGGVAENNETHRVFHLGTTFNEQLFPFKTTQQFKQIRLAR